MRQTKVNDEESSGPAWVEAKDDAKEVENERFPCNVDNSTLYPVTSRA